MNKKKIITIVAAILALALIAFGVFKLAPMLFSGKDVVNNDSATTPSSDAQQSTEPKKIKNPIDFATLQAGNDEIYAYIKVDGTKVDYPVVQSRQDDDFYLRHRAEDKAYSESGAVYSQYNNTLDFSDPVTVLYGHNGYGDTFFTTLHSFEDKKFFEEHDTFVIYTPDRKFTYKIFSAFKYDDRHLLNSFDLANEDVLAEFQKIITDPDSVLKNTREVTLDKNSRVVILSTCITGQKQNRYLVCGVLTNDEPTE